MEIGIRKSGDLRLLSLAGKIHLPQWRVICKHLDSLLEQGARRVVVALTGVTFLSEAALSALPEMAGKFRVNGADLLVLADGPGLAEIFRQSGCADSLGECFFSDRETLGRHLRDLGYPEGI
jgi:anti-anti-sigma factor